MKHKRVWLLVGIPGSGKSTYAKQQIQLAASLGFNHGYVSRDEVRFSMVKEDEDYFSKEKQVFKEFMRQVNKAIQKHDVVFIDATHINWASRNKTLRNINFDLPDTQISVGVIVMNTSVEECVRRNSLRTGRAKIPNSAIYKMQKDYTDPSTDPFEYDGIEFIGV